MLVSLYLKFQENFSSLKWTRALKKHRYFDCCYYLSYHPVSETDKQYPIVCMSTCIFYMVCVVCFWWQTGKTKETKTSIKSRLNHWRLHLIGLYLHFVLYQCIIPSRKLVSWEFQCIFKEEKNAIFIFELNKYILLDKGSMNESWYLISVADQVYNAHGEIYCKNISVYEKKLYKNYTKWTFRKILFECPGFFLSYIFVKLDKTKTLKLGVLNFFGLFTCSIWLELQPASLISKLKVLPYARLILLFLFEKIPITDYVLVFTKFWYCSLS